VSWLVFVQDTPGYGDDLNIMNNISLMMEYIEKQNQEWLQMELVGPQVQQHGHTILSLCTSKGCMVTQYCHYVLARAADRVGGAAIAAWSHSAGKGLMCDV
jgi:hypothetical protein